MLPASLRSPLLRLKQTPPRRVAWVAGVFTLVVAGFMVAEYFRVQRHDPLNHPPLQSAKEQLHSRPEEQAREHVRDLDLQVRQEFFGHLSRIGSGTFLLLTGGVVFLFAARRASLRKPALPLPPEDRAACEEAIQPRILARRMVALVAALFLCSMLVVGFTRNRLLDQPLRPAATASVTSVAKTPPPTLAEYRANWPRFRGPEGGGTAPSGTLPAGWNGKTGEGIRWTSPIPSRAMSSPVIWGQRLFLTGADVRAREIYCYDLTTGKLLWQRSLDAPLPRPPKVSDETGLAASTPATDGTRIYAIFATGELAAWDFTGALVWKKELGPLDNPYGHATSLVTSEDRLYVQLDQGQGNAGKSALYGIDGATGEILWQQKRAVPSSWATPIIIGPPNTPQIVTLGDPWMISYRPADGTELWRAKCLGSDLAPSPISAGGLVVAASPWNQLVALRPDGAGDVTQSGVAWSVTDDIPDITSPVSDGTLLVTVSTEGLLVCRNVQSGEKVWEKDLEMECHASPLLAGGQLFVFGIKGVTAIVKLGPQYQMVGRGEIEDEFFASPAVSGGRLYLRGAKNLYCVGPK